MFIIEVRHSTGISPVFIGNSGNMSAHMTHAGNKRVVIVTDQNVGALYGESVSKLFKNSDIITIPAGEESKSQQRLFELYEHFCRLGIKKSDYIVALGGGVIGDLVGYAAASYLRGVNLIQMPTSLLACVDSSVGGKTAINLPQGKNLVGTFYQPKAVYVNVDFLETLPPEQFDSGMGEVIKYAAIFDEHLFQILETHDRQSLDMEKVIATCIRHKSHIVCADEFDKGERKLLNFGHTIGHSLEKESNYELTHGQAVAAGMCMITQASEKFMLTMEGTYKRLSALVEKYGLPSHVKTNLEYVQMDKKNEADFISLVLISKIGTSFIQKVSNDKIPGLINALP